MKSLSRQEQGKQRELLGAISAKSKAAYDDYIPIHDMQKGDLERSMKELNKAMEEEEEHLADQGDGNLAADEKQRGIENIAYLRDIVNQQDAVYRNIMSRVQEGEPKRVRKERTDPTDEPLSSANPYQKKDGASVRVANACVVANSFSRKHARAERFTQNRDVILADDEQRIDQLRETHAQADARASQRHREIAERQHHIAFVAQQRRNEQQKMLKEIQRFQDQQFELLQLKHHPEALHSSQSQSQKTLPPVTPPHGAQSPSSMSKSEPKLSRTMAGIPIAKEIWQSHKLYQTTLDRWRNFEADNEKRTEAYWHKMLQGASRKEDKAEAKVSVLRRHVKDITFIRKFQQARSISIEGGIPGLGYETIDTVHMSDPESDSPQRGRLGTSSSSDPGTESIYQARLARVKAYHEELDRLAMEKREADLRKNEKNHQRSKEVFQQKSNKLKANMLEWEQRSQDSAMRRAKEAQRNDGEFHRKMSIKDQLLNDLRAQATQDRDDYFNVKTLVQQNAKIANEKLKETNRRKHQEKQEDKNLRAKESLDEFIKISEVRHAANSAELAREKCRIKASYDKAFSKSVAREIAQKAERHAQAKRRVGKPKTREEAMELQRLLKQDKLARNNRATPPQLALPPELTLPAHLFLSPKSNGKLNAAQLEERPDSAEDENDDFATEMETLSSTLLKESRGRPLGMSHNRATPSSLLSASVGGTSKSSEIRGASAVSSPARSTEASASEGEDGEQEFLADLQNRSAKWLNEMRMKAEDNLIV